MERRPRRGVVVVVVLVFRVSVGVVAGGGGGGRTNRKGEDAEALFLKRKRHTLLGCPSHPRQRCGSLLITVVPSRYTSLITMTHHYDSSL